AMGSRMMKKWIERPLLNKQAIEKRLNIVESFHAGFMEREMLRESLKSVYDMERLAARIAFGNVNARDLIQLKQSLRNIPEIKKILQQFPAPEMKELADELVYPEDIVDILEQSIIEDPPASITEGGIIKDGYNEQLDSYRDASRNGKQWIAELERKEKDLTNI